MGTCIPCDLRLPDAELIEHVQLVHPSDFGERLERMPDTDMTIDYDPDEYREN